MGVWIGSKKIAVIPCIALHPGIPAPPADFRDVILRRVFFDPDPVKSYDRSMRRYLHTVSYGRAVLDIKVLDTVTINWLQDHYEPDPTNFAQLYLSHLEAIKQAQPAVADYPYVMVIFPVVPQGTSPMLAHSFYNEDGGSGYMFFDDRMGVWAHELIHMTTTFGDLYWPTAGRPLTPGNLDEMDTAGAMHPSSFTKAKIGWIDAEDVRVVNAQQGATTHTLHSLALLQPPPPDRTTALRIPLPDSADHYLLVESREWLDDYDKFTANLAEGVPLEGVVIYDVDERVWSPLWLRRQGMVVGDGFVDDAQKFRIDVIEQLIGGGFRVNVRPLPPPPRCLEIASETSQLKADIRDLQAELDDEGADKPGLIREIKALQSRISALHEEAAGLGCEGWTNARRGFRAR
jgi:hypothetical protein